MIYETPVEKEYHDSWQALKKAMDALVAADMSRFIAADNAYLRAWQRYENALLAMGKDSYDVVAEAEAVLRAA